MNQISEKADRKLKAALDETRLLVLGVQILLGFEFQAVFQDGFDGLGRPDKYLSLGALELIVLSVAILIAPSMQHRLVEVGHSSRRLIEMTNRLASAALVPLTIALAISAYVVTQRIFGFAIGIAIGAVMGAVSAFCWFGLGLIIIGRQKESDKMPSSSTPLRNKIEQLLTEARLIIPGGQALFGFQFIAMMTSGFERLPDAAKIVHVVALCLIGLNVTIMMTPAALHRLSFDGEDSPRFFRLGSGLVMLGPLFLATGIAAEVYVVFLKAINDPHAAVAASIATVTVLTALWYVWPLLLRTFCRPL